MARSIALIAHSSRSDIYSSILSFKKYMKAAGIEVVDARAHADLSRTELIAVFGGDGTILWADRGIPDGKDRLRLGAERGGDCEGAAFADDRG